MNPERQRNSITDLGNVPVFAPQRVYDQYAVELRRTRDGTLMLRLQFGSYKAASDYFRLTAGSRLSHRVYIRLWEHTGKHWRVLEERHKRGFNDVKTLLNPE